MKNFGILLVFAWMLLLGHQDLFAQKKTEAPKSMRFTEAWVWEYSDEHGEQGQLTMYYSPEKNFWLFTPEAYGVSGEMIEWVLGKPNGTYVFKLTDEFGKASYESHKIEFNPVKGIPEYLIPTGKTESFGDREFGFPLLEGKEYRVVYEKTTDQATNYLGIVKANMLPVYYFNRLISDAKLPVQFFSDVPSNTLILSEKYVYSQGTKSYRFKFISHTYYEI
jgi:hypothetical protein